MPNEEEVITQENDTDTTENDEQGHQNPENESREDVEELKKKLATIEAQKDHWRKKAQEKKEDKKETVKEVSVTFKDSYALMQAGVHEEDIDEVVEYATFKKISVSEALKSDVVKTILSNKSEFRKTAEITNAGSARRGATKLSDEALLSKLKDGNVPTPGSEEAERVFWARRGGKR
jgi:hypothetical protein